ncbi:unnamed protein product [Rotaria magnacalcarata]|uniref:WD repeat and FYVE domain-containing protein 3 n=4 Tax=Rotaria magnacalcarata TaxID=392030 RepID=A0A819E4A3_9BILA|nr:unnamed protein product [Rotaria magnacalcarata]
MNKLLKTLINKRDGGGASSSSSSSPTTGSLEGTLSNNNTASQDILLTLTHLRKVFYEYQHPKIQWTQQEKNERLYSTLPMVIKVLSVLTNNEWEDRFPELHDYTLTLAKLLVYEIRMRADKEPNTRAASQAIIDYLEINEETNSLSGWSLLRSLKLLSTGPNIIMDKFAQASLPSTFVKCLYLFFDLPDIPITHSTSDAISPKEKRILLQQIFFQLLSRIAMSNSCVDELTRRDDLLLLFSAISSNCPERNKPWRMQASEMLVLIGKHSLQSAIQCIHSVRCISQCVDSLRRATCDLSLIEIAGVYETLINLIIESASLSSILVDDFRLAHCYVHVKDIILRLENEWINDESEKLFARFITLLSDFSYAGYNELKLSGRPETIIDIPNFAMPQPKKTGFIVRNTSAFTILQSIFQQSTHPFLVNIVFDAISSIILADNANYFICGENLSPITEVLYNKSNDVQLKIYDLLEFIVFQLKFIPHRELVNLSIMLKSHTCVQSHKNCVKYLIHILKFNNVLKDALRELGFIEVLISRLHQFATLLKESIQDPNDKGDNMDQEEKELGFMVMEALALLLSHNQKNAKIFREHGGARLAHNIIPYRLCRIAALTVVLHLVLCTGGEDDTGTLLGLIHTAKLEELEMKSVILKGFLYILRESHRTRTVFRKVGGFVYIVSLLISMEGCLAVPPKNPWITVSRHEILSIIRLILNTLTVAMRFEPGNARLFENEVRWQSLSDAIKLLGCFTNEMRLTDSTSLSKFDYASTHNYNIFEQLFYSLDERTVSSTNLPLELINACHIARCFHDIALDCVDNYSNFADDFTIDKISQSLINPTLKNEPVKQGTSMDNNDESVSSPLFRTTTLNMPTARTPATFTSYMEEPIIVYPGAIVCFLQIISCIPKMIDEQYSNRLQYFLMLTLKNLLKYDRNLQIMATYGFPQHILYICEIALQNENHHLHTSVEYIFERLATFILPVRTSRQFLRMGIDSILSPKLLMNSSKDLILINKSFVPLNRIKCLVSMTTSRDIRRDTQVLLSSNSPTGIMSNTSSLISPPFVEFNMGIEGFGALLLPCLSPQSVTSSTNVVGNFGMVTMTNEIILQGGMTLTNGGERTFPPQYGMTYSTWFYVDKFGPIKDSVHPIRLLSVIRNTFNREDYRFVLQVYIHPKDKSLLVSTQEHPFQDCHNDAVYIDDIKSDGLVKFTCSEMMIEQRWTQIALVWAKGMLKNSAITLYINGKQIAIQKLHYITNMAVPPGNSISTFAYIGSLPIQRVHSSVQWRQGPCFLIDEILTSQIIVAMYAAGPNYIGSFQAVCIDPLSDVFSPLFPEDRIIFGLHPASFFETTLSHFKKLYNKNDAKLIAKQLNMPTNESTVPIRILYNIAAPYSGPARTIGGVVIGYLGVRIFVPNPVSKTIEHIGGPNVMLGLIAMSNDIESFYASVKAFVCILKSNKQVQNELLRTRAYQILGYLFLKKRHLINSHILHLTCTLVGTIDTIRESIAITNPAAFEHILCEFEIWKGASVDIQKSLFDHLLDVFLTSDTQNLMMNQKLSQKINLMARLLNLLKDGSLHESTRLIIISLIRVLLVTYKNTNDILKLGQFLVYLLPSSSISEKNANISGSMDELSVGIQNIILRNFLLEMLAKTIAEEKRSQTNLTDEFLTHLGYDWLLLFLQSNLHPRTIILTTKFLIACLLSSSNALTRFHDNAMLLINPSTTNTSVTATTTTAGITVSSPTSSANTPTPLSPLTTINESWINVFNDRTANKASFGLGIDSTAGLGNNTNASIPLPGFVLLQYIFAQRSEIIPIYYLLTSLIFRQIPTDDMMEQTELTVEKLLKLVNIPNPLAASLSVSSASTSKQQSSTQQQYELDACPILLAMIRNLASQDNEQAEQNGLAVLKFLHQLYRRKCEFFNYAQTVEYLSFLCAIVFPPALSNQISFDLPSTFFRQKNVNNEESVSPNTSLDPLIAAFTSNVTLRGATVDIVRDIIIDSLYSNTARIPNVIDYFLSALPENMNSDITYQIFVQCIFKSIIEHLETSGLCPTTITEDQTNALPFGLGDDQGRTPFSRTLSSITSHSSSNNFNMSSYKLLLENVTHFIERMVDKIWDIDYREPKQIFEFITKIINQAKKRGSNTFMDGLFRSLNRTILFELSRKIDSFGDQMTALDALHRLANNRQLIFSDSNQDVEFFGCLCYCLIILIDETGTKQFSEDSSSRSTWYHRLDSPVSPMQPNKSLIINAAQRIWSELYMKKKPALEEILKMNFSQLVTQNKTTLVDVSESLFEPATKVWTRFIEGELRITDKIQQQIMHVGSRIQRLTGGVTGGFRSSLHQLRGTKVKREQVKLDRAIVQSALALMSVNISSVKENVDNEYRRLGQNTEQKFNYLYEEWLAIEHDLLRERGLWGFDEPDPLAKYKLDFIEGPCRMRKRMVLNEDFYKHYPYRIPIEHNKRKFNPPVSFDSKQYADRQCQRVDRLLITSPLSIDSTVVNSSPTVKETNEPVSPQPASTPLIVMASKESNELSPTSPTDAMVRQDSELWTNEEEKELLAPTLLSVRKKTLSNDMIPEETTIGEEDEEEEEDPINTNLEQDEAEAEAQQSPAPANAIVEMTQTNQNVLRLLEDDEKISLAFRCARIEGLDGSEGILIFGREHFYILEGYTYNTEKNEIVDLDKCRNDYVPLIPKSSTITNADLIQFRKECSKFAYEDIKEVHKRRHILQPIALELFAADGRNYLLVFVRKERSKVYQRLLNSATELTDSAIHSVSGQRRSINIEQGTSFIGSLMGERSVTQRWEKGEISNFQYLMHLNTLAGRSYNDLMQYPVFPWILADYDSKELNLTNPVTFRDLSKPMGAQTIDRLVQFQKRYAEWDDPTGSTPAYHYGTHYSSAMIVASYLVRTEPFAQVFLRLQGGHFDLADRMFHSIKDSWFSASKNNMADVKELIPEFFYLPDFLLNTNKFDLGKKQNGLALNDVILPAWSKNDPREFIRIHRMALESDYVSAHLNEWIDLIFGYKQEGPAANEATNVFHHLFYEGAVNVDDISDPLERSAIIGFINNFGQIPKQLFKRPHPQKKLSRSLMDSIGIERNLFFNHVNSLRPSRLPIKELKSAVGLILPTDKSLIALEQCKAIIPPNYTRCIQYGFPDESLRIMPVDSDKSLMIYELVQDGKITNVLCPTSEYVITAGTNTLINVWEISKGRHRRLHLKTRLTGHNDIITCLTASQAYRILISGSDDQTCIVWDLNRLHFIRQLPNHAGSISCICVNELTGDIASAAGSYLYVWTINGQLLASINTMAYSRQQSILCIAMSQMNEWDDENVIITGSSDGVVRMWTIGYDQVVDEPSSLSPLILASTEDQSRVVSISQPSLMKLQSNTSQISIDSDVESDEGEGKSALTSTGPCLSSQIDPSFDDDGELNVNKDTLDLPSVAVLNSPTGSDKFIVVTDVEILEAKSNTNEAHNKSTYLDLKEGFKWDRRLNYRGKLTMHTAFERKENISPAAVTAIGIAKHVSFDCWIVSDSPGRTNADHWIKDETVGACKDCSIRFSFAERRHHCRYCGQLFCARCSRFETDIPRMKIFKNVRVCRQCYLTIKEQKSSTSTNNS